MPTTYPTTDPPPEPPIVAEDDLDGVSREDLVAAEIAKHKEILEPDTPTTQRLTELNVLMREMGHAFADLHADMRKVINTLREMRDAIKDAASGKGDEGRGSGPGETRDPAGDRERVREGGQAGGDAGEEGDEEALKP